MMISHFYGLHRVLSPRGVFPQAAERLDASKRIHPSEVRIRVERLHIDAASFRQIVEVTGGRRPAIEKHIHALVKKRGKMHNRITNSGGMLMGTVDKVGRNAGDRDFVAGDRVATLVSLTLTPLEISTITAVHVDRNQLECEGHAILFASGAAQRMPEDLSPEVAMAVFDVCGAPALVSRIVKEERRQGRPVQRVIVLGGGKAGVLSAAQAKKEVGEKGRVIVIEKERAAVDALKSFSFIDRVLTADLTDPVRTLDVVTRATQGQMADLIVNCANVPKTEMSSILAANQSGVVLFFNMATNFQAAVLGAEGIGHAGRLIMGNGYTPGHADLALNLVREDSQLRGWFERATDPRGQPKGRAN